MNVVTLYQAMCTVENTCVGCAFRHNDEYRTIHECDKDKVFLVL